MIDDVIYLPGPTLPASTPATQPSLLPETQAPATSIPQPPATPPTAKTRRGSEARQMEVVKAIRFTAGELADAEAQASAAGLSLEDYLREEACKEPETRGSEAHTTRRPTVKYLRMTAATAQQIAALAERAGLSFGSYVRARGCKRPVTLTTRRPPVEKLELARLLGLLGNATSNLNQIARQLNGDGDVPLVATQDGIAIVAAAAAEIIRSLGREPQPRAAARVAR